LRAVLTVARDPSRAELQLATDSWLRSKSFETMGWAERLSGPEALAAVPASPAAAAGNQDAGRSNGILPLADAVAESAVVGPSARERLLTIGLPLPSAAQTSAASSPDEPLALRFVQAGSKADTARVIERFAARETRAAIERTLQSGRPAASVGFAASQVDGPQQDVHLAVYQAVYSVSP
jgi:hypothetical protein